MSKYIDAEKLLARIKEHIELMEPPQSHYSQARIDEANEILSDIDCLQQEQSEVNLEEELKDMVARNAASIWCRCFKCDGIINATSSKCDKEKLLTCRKWYDGYKTALLALGDKRIFNARKEK